MAYWLLKSEPDVFSIDDLRDRPNQIEPWDGVRNYQVRNMFRDQMTPGDLGFFYHSNCEVPGIYGVLSIASKGYPDPTQFNPDSKYYDPKAKPAEPRWMLVDVKYERHFKRPVSLEEMRRYADAELAGMQILMRGTRLSVTPVRPEHWAFIEQLESRSAT